MTSNVPPSLLSFSYATQEEGKSPSQPQYNMISIHEEEVQHVNSSNIFEEQSIVILENDE